MALLSISIGAVFFLLAIAWAAYIAVSGSNSSGFAFGFILSVFPAIFALLLVVPSTFIRLFVIFKNRPTQSASEKIVLSFGIVITCVYVWAALDLALR